MTPRVTVLMPVYNGERYLREAINSILAQTFTDFEFLIINDGSTDKSAEIINSYPDPRIRLVHNDKNLGLIETLNRGMGLALGEYIARMDCDDICLPNRLLKQVIFMDSHSDVGICGSWIKVIGDAEYIKRYPDTHEQISSHMLFECAIAHPSVMLRKKIIFDEKLFYNSDFKYTEDYDLWERSACKTRLANLPEVLLHYRMHQKAVSAINCYDQVINANKIRHRQFKKLGIVNEDRYSSSHELISRNLRICTGTELTQAEKWLNTLIEANKKMNAYSKNMFSTTVAHFWFRSCYAASGLGFWAFKKYLKSELSKPGQEGLLNLLKFIIKCLIRS